jgi:MYXO-CTERM domain-containing protein
VANTTCKDKDTLLSPDGSETDCAPYHCAAGACRESCSTNNDCQTGFACKGDICRVIDEDEVSDVDAAAPMASSGPGAKTEAQSESGCGCRIGGASGQHSAGWVALLALGLEWRRRSSTTVIATLLSVLPGCKKVVQATVNEAEDTPPAASSRDNNDMQLVDCSDAAQPETHAGPTMVAVGRRDESCVWIDTTEVTAAQMLPFVQLPSAARVGRYPDGCTPSELLASDFMTGQMPAANVAWCDAVAFCAFAGKRLCDDKGKASEWQTVCTDGDHGQFAFDELADSELCRLDADAPVLVGSLDECRTPTGVVDLVGNVREWTAECSGSAPDVSCAVRGGSYLDGPSTSGCDASKSVARDRVAADIGFRCCADVP